MRSSLEEFRRGLDRDLRGLGGDRRDLSARSSEDELRNLSRDLDLRNLSRDLDLWDLSRDLDLRDLSRDLDLRDLSRDLDLRDLSLRLCDRDLSNSVFRDLDKLASGDPETLREVLPLVAAAGLTGKVRMKVPINLRQNVKPLNPD